MRTLMYEVAAHGYGRKRVRRGPAEGLLNWPQHVWTRLNTRPLGLARAKMLANEHPTHAVVTVWGTADKVHDNGKPPNVPDGWYPADTL